MVLRRWQLQLSLPIGVTDEHTGYGSCRLIDENPLPVNISRSRKYRVAEGQVAGIVIQGDAPGTDRRFAARINIQGAFPFQDGAGLQVKPDGGLGIDAFNHRCRHLAVIHLHQLGVEEQGPVQAGTVVDLEPQDVLPFNQRFPTEKYILRQATTVEPRVDRGRDYVAWISQPPASNLDAIDVGDKAIVVINPQQQGPAGRRVGNIKGVAGVKDPLVDRKHRELGGKSG